MWVASANAQPIKQHAIAPESDSSNTYRFALAKEWIKKSGVEELALRELHNGLTKDLDTSSTLTEEDRRINRRVAQILDEELEKVFPVLSTL